MVKEVDVSEFETLWRFITKRRPAVVQDRNEMEYIYGLIKDANAESYLEIGTAEGDSLYVFGGLVKHPHGVDLCEPHTFDKRDEVCKLLKDNGRIPLVYVGDSTKEEVYRNVVCNRFDIVFIDGGHDYETVLSDCKNYAPLATKYVFWHDIQLPEVKRAVDEYIATLDAPDYSTFINSDCYGYGILKVSK